MKKIFYISLVFLCLNVFSQSEITKNVIVDASGWKRIAQLNENGGRGYKEITLITKGGKRNPTISKISWFKGWSDYGGLHIESLSNVHLWTDARITFDGTYSYLEVNFKVSIPVLSVYLNSAAWIGGGSVIEGVLPNGGGDVIASAKFGKLNSGENDLFVAYDGNVGVGTAYPKTKLSLNNNKGQSINFLSGENSSGYSLNVGVNDDGINFQHNSLSRGFNFKNKDNTLVKITYDGSLGIGTTDPKGYKLAIAGKAIAEEVVVKLQSAWPDYVFVDDYKLPTLYEVEQHINKKGHLINIPSAKEVQEKGVELGEMNKKLLQKIEELTLYTIQQQKELDAEKKKNSTLEQRLSKLEKLIQEKLE